MPSAEGAYALDELELILGDPPVPAVRNGKPYISDEDRKAITEEAKLQERIGRIDPAEIANLIVERLDFEWHSNTENSPNSMDAFYHWLNSEVHYELKRRLNGKEPTNVPHELYVSVRSNVLIAVTRRAIAMIDMWGGSALPWGGTGNIRGNVRPFYPGPSAH